MPSLVFVVVVVLNSIFISFFFLAGSICFSGAVKNAAVNQTTVAGDLRVQGQPDLHGSRTARATQRGPVLKRKKKKAQQDTLQAALTSINLESFRCVLRDGAAGSWEGAGPSQFDKPPKCLPHGRHFVTCHRHFVMPAILSRVRRTLVVQL